MTTVHTLSWSGSTSLFTRITGHIHIIPLEQDLATTARLEIVVYYFNKSFFFLIHILAVCIHTNGLFDKALQKIINFNSSSAAKAAQLGGKNK